MLKALSTLVIVAIAAGSVAYFGAPEAKPAQPIAPPAPVSVGAPPDQSLGQVSVTKCKCSGPVDCTCDACECKNGNECKTPQVKAQSAYRAIVKTCEAAEKGNCDCFDNGGCKCEGDNQCKAGYQPSIDVAVVCPTCKGKQVCQTCNGSGTVEPNLAAPAEPKYTEPAKPAAPTPVAAKPPEYVRVWQPSYGRFGRQRGGQWVTVLKSQPNYNGTQPVRYRGGCAGGNFR